MARNLYWLVYSRALSPLHLHDVFHVLSTTETSAFADNVKCPPRNPRYIPKKWHLSRNWRKESECPSEISISTLHFFPKDYRIYGGCILVLVSIYISLSITLVTCGKSYSGLHTGAPLFVWNVFVCINAVYTMFKPMQYYQKSLSQHGETNPPTVCEVDTINETFETVIEYCVAASFLFLICDWILGFFRCWISRKVIASGGRRIYDIKSMLQG